MLLHERYQPGRIWFPSTGNDVALGNNCEGTKDIRFFPKVTYNVFNDSSSTERPQSLARRNRTYSPEVSFAQLSDRIKKLADTPLREIGLELESQLTFLQRASNTNPENGEILKVFLSQVATILQILPITFDDRFWFDAEMVRAIASGWNRTGQRLTGTILTKPESEWAHKSVYIPVGSNREQGKSINVIIVPGSDSLSDVDLLDYPWIFHELAHNLFYYDDSLFVESFSQRINSFLGALRLRAIADQGSAKTKSQATINKIEKFWYPTLTHKNWGHEMAMDIVALWASGPAFLAAFQDKVEDKSCDPYRVDKVHPPYAVRAMALSRASKILGWVDEARGIKNLIANWRKSSWARQVDNSYMALTDPKLLDGVVECALATCDSYSIPNCDRNDILRISRMLETHQMPPFGTDLIVAAWLAREQHHNEAYDEWESETIRSLMNSFTS